MYANHLEVIEEDELAQQSVDLRMIPEEAL
jgi:hypothetical protein